MCTSPMRCPALRKPRKGMLQKAMRRVRIPLEHGEHARGLLHIRARYILSFSQPTGLLEQVGRIFTVVLQEREPRVQTQGQGSLGVRAGCV